MKQTTAIIAFILKAPLKKYGDFVQKFLLKEVKFFNHNLIGMDNITQEIENKYI